MLVSIDYEINYKHPKLPFAFSESASAPPEPVTEWID
jgi:hypothetical protein